MTTDTHTPAILHGGDSVVFRRLFGADPVLDLSTGVNPAAWPLPSLPDAVWQLLPDRERVEDLRRAAAAWLEAPSPALLALAPGSQALIQLLPRLRPPGRVAVLGPTYAEHARCWGLAGHRVEAVFSLEAALASGAPVIVTVRPNNPDGGVLPRRALLDAAAIQAGRGGMLVVDEAFADALPGCSLAPWAGRPGLVILRSFGKFFGLAGLRLGFLLAPAETAAAVSAALGPWAVAGPALEIGIAALADTGWAAATRARLARDAARLDGLLAAAGLAVTGGTPLFRLVESPGSPRLFRHLGQRGIAVRRFPEHPRRLRFGLPGIASDWELLAAALAAFPAPGQAARRARSCDPDAKHG